MTKSQVIITGAFRFPDGDAAAARVLGVAKSFRSLGRDVVLAGWESVSRRSDMGEDGDYSYQGFPYFSQGEFRSGDLSPLRRLWRYLWAGSNTLNWLKGRDSERIEAIVAYHGGSLFLLRLLLYCKRRRIRLVVDCTEWYDGASLVGGRFGVAHLDNEFRLRVVNRIIGNVIAISSYLDSYYRSLGCRVVRIPPTIDLSESKWILNERGSEGGEGLRLVYAGVPGKKDLLVSVLRGLRTLKDSGERIVLHLLGPSYEDLLNCVDGDEALLSSIGSLLVLHGRVPQADVPRLVAQADFSILLRPQKRFAAAGFSTKLVESLAAGVPVIANNTGDIGLFVRDGMEGILVSDHSADAFVEGVRRAMRLSRSEMNALRIRARMSAEANFSFSSYSECLRTLLE